MKVITSDNHIIRPFRVNKTWTVYYVYSGSNDPTSSVSIDVADAPPSDWNTWSTSNSQNDGGIYTQPLYSSVQHTFYTGSNSSGLNYIPLGTRNKQFYPTGSQFYVINIRQRSYGESIRQNSFALSGAGNTTIYDDGNGHLVSSATPNVIVGNIFYQSGVAVVQQDTGSQALTEFVVSGGLYLDVGDPVTVQYQSIHTIYEHKIVCTLDPNEFNFSTNPTLRSTGSIDSDPMPRVEMVFSGTLEPYWTTLGLYNDVGEMVAIAKVPKPVKRAIDTQQTIIVRLDA